MLAIGDGDGCDGGCSGSRAASVLYSNNPIKTATRYGSFAFESDLNQRRGHGQAHPSSLLAPPPFCFKFQSVLFGRGGAAMIDDGGG